MFLYHSVEMEHLMTVGPCFRIADIRAIQLNPRYRVWAVSEAQNSARGRDWDTENFQLICQ